MPAMLKGRKYRCRNIRRFNSPQETGVFVTFATDGETVWMLDDGGRGSSENNIDYHFAKHQNDQHIRALTIADYCEGARVTLQNVIRNFR